MKCAGSYTSLAVVRPVLRIRALFPELGHGLGSLVNSLCYEPYS